ncbi:hypothetical protein HDU97_003565 [Phlyctochytrium planicorne]|nr:hypothetical protein HDU97_003565 [Phlyctochytrium planicorne]
MFSILFGSFLLLWLAFVASDLRNITAILAVFTRQLPFKMVSLTGRPIFKNRRANRRYLARQRKRNRVRFGSFEAPTFSGVYLLSQPKAIALLRFLSIPIQYLCLLESLQGLQRRVDTALIRNSKFLTSGSAEPFQDVNNFECLPDHLRPTYITLTTTKLLTFGSPATFEDVVPMRPYSMNPCLFFPQDLLTLLQSGFGLPHFRHTVSVLSNPTRKVCLVPKPMDVSEMEVNIVELVKSCKAFLHLEAMMVDGVTAVLAYEGFDMTLHDFTCTFAFEPDFLRFIVYQVQSALKFLHGMAFAHGSVTNIRRAINEHCIFVQLSGSSRSIKIGGLHHIDAVYPEDVVNLKDPKDHPMAEDWQSLGELMASMLSNYLLGPNSFNSEAIKEKWVEAFFRATSPYDVAAWVVFEQDLEATYVDLAISLLNNMVGGGKIGAHPFIRLVPTEWDDNTFEIDTLSIQLLESSRCSVSCSEAFCFCGSPSLRVISVTSLPFLPSSRGSYLSRWFPSLGDQYSRTAVPTGGTSPDSGNEIGSALVLSRLLHSRLESLQGLQRLVDTALIRNTKLLTFGLAEAFQDMNNFECLPDHLRLPIFTTTKLLTFGSPATFEDVIPMRPYSMNPRLFFPQDLLTLLQSGFGLPHFRHTVSILSNPTRKVCLVPKPMDVSEMEVNIVELVKSCKAFLHLEAMMVDGVTAVLAYEGFDMTLHDFTCTFAFEPNFLRFIVYQVQSALKFLHGMAFAHGSVTNIRRAINEHCIFVQLSGSSRSIKIGGLHHVDAVYPEDVANLKDPKDHPMAEDWQSLGELMASMLANYLLGPNSFNSEAIKEKWVEAFFRATSAYDVAAWAVFEQDLEATYVDLTISLLNNMVGGGKIGAHPLIKLVPTEWDDNTFAIDSTVQCPWGVAVHGPRPKIQEP